MHRAQDIHKLKFTDSLNRLNIHHDLGNDGVNQIAPACDTQKDKVFPTNTLEAVKAMLLNHKEDFAKGHGTLHLKLADSNTLRTSPSCIGKYHHLAPSGSRTHMGPQCFKSS